nr:MAG TPA: hypothetical protein [Caudoviricetes sp.]
MSVFSFSESIFSLPFSLKSCRFCQFFTSFSILFLTILKLSENFSSYSESRKFTPLPFSREISKYLQSLLYIPVLHSEKIAEN